MLFTLGNDRRDEGLAGDIDRRVAHVEDRVDGQQRANTFRGRPSVDKVSVSMTTAPVRPAVAADPSTDTKTIRTYSWIPSGIWLNRAMKIAENAG